MKLIIDIPEDVYKRTKFYKEFRDLNDCVITIKALENGTPLPKGHGRLIDADELAKEADEFELDDDIYMLIYEADIYNAPTIIEADKESEERNE